MGWKFLPHPCTPLRIRFTLTWTTWQLAWDGFLCYFVSAVFSVYSVSIVCAVKRQRDGFILCSIRMGHLTTKKAFCLIASRKEEKVSFVSSPKQDLRASTNRNFRHTKNGHLPFRNQNDLFARFCKWTLWNLINSTSWKIIHIVSYDNNKLSQYNMIKLFFFQCLDSAMCVQSCLQNTRYSRYLMERIPQVTGFQIAVIVTEWVNWIYFTINLVCHGSIPRFGKHFSRVYGIDANPESRVT